MASELLPLEYDFGRGKLSVRNVFIFLALITGLAGGGWLYWRASRTAGRSTARSISREVTPQMRKINTTVTATGTMRLQSGAEVRVGAQISGIVTKLNVTVGTHIEKGAVIAEIDSRGLSARIAQAQAQIQVDQSTVDKLERDFARSRALLNEKLVPRQQTEELDADLRTGQAKLEKSRSDLAVVESDLPYLTVRAPISGTVASVSTQQGETIAASFSAPSFVTLIEDRALELVAMVDETDIATVRPSDPVTFIAETYPSLEFHGVVNRVAPKASIISGVVNYEVGVEVRSGLNLLRPDMTANVTIATAAREALMIPAEAVRKEGERQFVFVSRNGAPEKREIAVGQRDGGWIEVTRALRPVDRVILGGS